LLTPPGGADPAGELVLGERQGDLEAIGGRLPNRSAISTRRADTRPIVFVGAELDPLAVRRRAAGDDRTHRAGYATRP
jgi:hypothetical protein